MMEINGFITTAVMMTLAGLTYGQVPLSPLSNNDLSNGDFRFQSRCSIPCSGSYQPNDLQITLVLSKTVSKFYSFGVFSSEGDHSYSFYWQIRNNDNIYTGSDGECVFDVQFDYPTPQYPVPTGTCQIGWPTPTTCPFDMTADSSTCNDVVKHNLTECYNQTTFSACCFTCLQHQQTIPNCPYGDRNVTSCTNLDREQCYTMSGQCCETCYYVAEQSLPGCIYGNRDHEFCDTIVPYQCYNSTIESLCCDTCIGLMDLNSPSCIYGDRHEGCYNIDRRDCYDSDIRASCCYSCDHMANDNPGCEYGDVDECKNITIASCSHQHVMDTCCESCDFLITNKCRMIPDDPKCNVLGSHNCYDPDTVRYCCNTCLRHYQMAYGITHNDCAEDDPGWCGDIVGRDCYQDNTRAECCYTCLQYYDSTLDANCLYGDRTPGQCDRIQAWDCYNYNTEYNCCQECSYSFMPSLPTTCRYGNKASTCISTETSPFNASSCYNTATEDRCCETCSSYNKAAEYGEECRYGDRINDCYRYEQYRCYNDTDRNICCKSCQNIEDQSNPDCRYGDKAPSCNNIPARECYTRENECCSTCQFRVKQNNIADCKYGDRTNCSSVTTAQCYNTFTSERCCETCHYLLNQGQNDCTTGDDSPNCSSIQPWECYTRETECCASCPTLVVNNYANCKYGDRAVRCQYIEARDCYDTSTETECCDTCRAYIESNLPVSCRYGDKIESCYSITQHGAECYNNSRRDQCCHTCRNIKSNDRECLYGDKNIQCNNIQRRQCYDFDVEEECCVTCPDYHDDSLPGCEYGDRYPYCDVSYCGSYTRDQLQDCCETCRDHVPTTSEVTTPSTPPSGSDDKQTSDSGKQTAIPNVPTVKTPRPKKTTNIQSTTTPATITTTITTKESSNILSKLIDSTLPIVGGVIGGVLLVAAIIIIACFFMRRKRTEKSRDAIPKMEALQSQHHRHNPQLLGNNARSNHVNTVPDYHNNHVPSNRSNTAPGNHSNGLAQQPQRVHYQRAPNRRPESVADEEVYDFIDPDDVQTVVGIPASRRPTLPRRGEAGYIEPTHGATNPAYTKDLKDNIHGTDDHMYHTLMKEQHEHEYLQFQNEYLKV